MAQAYSTIVILVFLNDGFPNIVKFKKYNSLKMANLGQTETNQGYHWLPFLTDTI